MKFIQAGVSIKFEVGSWLEKSERLYEQGAVRPLNLGGSGGMPAISFYLAIHLLNRKLHWGTVLLPVLLRNYGTNYRWILGAPEQ